MAVVTPLNNFLGPEGDTVTVDEQLLNTEYWISGVALNPIPPACVSSVYVWASRCNSVGFQPIQKRLLLGCIAALPR